MDGTAQAAIGYIGLILGFATLWIWADQRRRFRRGSHPAWEDIELGARDVARQIESSERRVNVILAMGARGAIAGWRISGHLSSRPTVIAGVTRRRSTAVQPAQFPNGVLAMNDEWEVEFPSAILSFDLPSILIVDDFARHGSAIQSLSDQIRQRTGGNAEIRSAVVMAMPAAIENGLIGFYAFKSKSDRYWFPWGRAE